MTHNNSNPKQKRYKAPMVKKHVTLSELWRKGYGRSYIWQNIFVTFKDEVAKYLKVIYQPGPRPVTKLMLLDKDLLELEPIIKDVPVEISNKTVQDEIYKKITYLYTEIGHKLCSTRTSKSGNTYTVRYGFRSGKFKPLVSLKERPKNEYD